MRLLIQRVKEASVTVNQQVCGKIKKGVLIFLGIHKNDTSQQIDWLVQKLIHLRIFPDEERKMNRNIQEAGGEILVVSQFTLYGNCLNGRRPDFIEAALPDIALPLYEQFNKELTRALGHSIQTGLFGALMEVALINDGPATFLLER